MNTTGERAERRPALDLHAASDPGTARDHNEDATAVFVEDAGRAIVVVADGVSGAAGGEVASHMAVEVVIRAVREGEPRLPLGQRLYRAFQQANIEVYDRAIAVPELRGMATTLTAAAIDGAELTVVHVGDSRLYLVRDGRIVQITKDHTLAAEKARLGLLSRERAQSHPDRCALTRSVGRELIVSRDRASHRLSDGDRLVLCSDGLYNVLEDAEIERTVHGRAAADASRALLEAANARGTPDNVTAAVVCFSGPTSPEAPPEGFTARVRRLFCR